jgi:1,4-dihydroxy-2-naphthoyl-CoA hydrolase
VRADKASVSAAVPVGAIGAFLNLPEGSKGTTRTDSKTNLMAAAPVGAVLAAMAEPVSVGLWLYPA